MAFGVRFASRFIKGLTFVERYLRRLTAIIFIGIGVYFIITYLFGLNLITLAG